MQQITASNGDVVALVERRLTLTSPEGEVLLDEQIPPDVVIPSASTIHLAVGTAENRRTVWCAVLGGEKQSVVFKAYLHQD